jgi:hypothetical protein
MTKQRTRHPRIRNNRTASPKRPLIGLIAVLLILCGLTGSLFVVSSQWYTDSETKVTYEVVETNRPFYAGSPVGAQAATSPLSDIFSPEVQYWAALIKAWAVVYQVDPNLIATVIQIESCGDPLVSSPAGAQGLFQVMPFHFDAGEDMLDVQTNARRGLEYLVGSLERSDGHVGLALAGYNGGHGIISRGWAAWTTETQRYYYWGSRIYAEAISGMSSSATLSEWLEVGGHSLCLQANQRQQQIEQEQQAKAVSS